MVFYYALFPKCTETPLRTLASVWYYQTPLSSVMAPITSFVGTASHQDHWPTVSLHSTYVNGTGTVPQSSFYDLDISTHCM